MLGGEAMRVIVAILFLLLPSFASADHCRVRQNAVVVQDFAAVSFAVPIGVPVAQVTPAFYSYNATAQAYQPRATAQSDDAKLFEEFIAWKASRVQAASVPQSPFAATCVKCHSQGGTGFAHHDFSKPLTSDDKLAAIDAIVQGTMPPKRTLDPQVRADIVAELSKREKQVKAAVVPEVKP